ncbi:hypothetical protein EVAR_68677_1 [Eumeta japonica]|uniref:Uncharacterized protein n=1 Tax=Eumeta variegata TaxID=151549 RepID=A0A4C2AG19_EUMVA|nr:hypothetical protein EVAR_68677_1 [Eumeta japonica]
MLYGSLGIHFELVTCYGVNGKTWEGPCPFRKPHRIQVERDGDSASGIGLEVESVTLKPEGTVQHPKLFRFELPANDVMRSGKVSCIVLCATGPNHETTIRRLITSSQFISLALCAGVHIELLAPVVTTVLVTTDAHKVDAILEKVEQDRHISSYHIAEEPGIDHKIVSTHLEKPDIQKKVDTWVLYAAPAPVLIGMDSVFLIDTNLHKTPASGRAAGVVPPEAASIQMLLNVYNEESKSQYVYVMGDVRAASKRAHVLSAPAQKIYYGPLLKETRTYSRAACYRNHIAKTGVARETRPYRIQISEAGGTVFTAFGNIFGDTADALAAELGRARWAARALQPRAFGRLKGEAPDTAGAYTCRSIAVYSGPPGLPFRGRPRAGRAART